jgi:hypothetical protein
LELQRQQEVTKQAEAKTKEAEFKAQANAYAKVHMHGSTCCACILLHSSAAEQKRVLISNLQDSHAPAACYQLPAATDMPLDTCRTADSSAMYCYSLCIRPNFANHSSAFSLSPQCLLPQVHTQLPLKPPNTRDTQEQEHIRWEEQRKTMSEEAQRQAQLAQYNDELARKRQQAEHELQRQRNGEMVSLQEQAAARKEAERLRIEQQIQAERRAADQYAVRADEAAVVVAPAVIQS